MKEGKQGMIRRGFLKAFAGLVGLGGAAGCGGMNQGESTLATTPTLRIRIRLNDGTVKTSWVPRGSTVLTAIMQVFSYRHRSDGLTIINGIRGHWQYTIDDIKPWGYAGDVHLISNCRIGLHLIR